jgi:hypothetical protein
MTTAKMNPSQQNAATIEREISWFSRVLDVAMQQYFDESTEYVDVQDITAPDIKGDKSEYAALITQYSMNFDERLILILTLLPHVRPQLLDLLFIRNKSLDRG